MKILFGMLFFFGLSLTAFTQEAPTVKKQNEMYTKVYHFEPARWSTLSTTLVSNFSGSQTSADPFGGEDPFGSGKSTLPWARKQATKQDTQNFFTTSFGVTFPEGSWIKVAQQMGFTVIMHNTKKNHERFTFFWRKSSPVHVSIALRAVSFDAKEIEEIERTSKRDLSEKELLSLWQDGKGETLHRQSVTTLNGVNAILEMVDEIIYPTEMNTLTNKPDEIRYGGFETREVGMILNVTPTINPNHETIHLVLLPEISELRPEPSTKTNGLAPVTPVYRSLNVTTSLAVITEQNRVAGRTISQDQTKEIVLFVSATLKNPDGTISEVPDLSIFQEDKITE